MLDKDALYQWLETEVSDAANEMRRSEFQMSAVNYWYYFGQVAAYQTVKRKLLSSEDIQEAIESRQEAGSQ